jgi:Zn-dependent protease with chaperone function
MPIECRLCGSGASRGEAMFKQVALTAVLIIAFTVTVAGQATKNLVSDSNANGKREEFLGDAEVARAIERLGDLSPAAIRERLKQMRIPAYLAGPVLVNRIIEMKDLPIVKSNSVDRLKAVVQPVLDYHERGRMPIYVLRSDRPKAYLVERAVIIITTSMMHIARDAEIRGVIAHELAHEYVWDERVKAKRNEDEKLMRECELFCDAVAAFTLKEIGDDPASYGRILQRIAIVGIKSDITMWKKSDTHPSLDARIKLNKFLCRRFD